MNSSENPATFVASIRGLAHGGAGVGTISTCEDKAELVGKTCFVSYTIPGEEIEASLEIDSKTFVEAGLLKVLQQSADRVEAPCPYFGSCGGCDLQHMNLEAQRKFKLEMVQGYLQKQAGIEDASIAELYAQELGGWAYRKRVIFHLNREGQIGFYHKKTKRILEISQCLIALPEINQALSLLKSNLSDFGGIVEDIVVEFVDQQLFIELKLRPKLKDGKQYHFAEILGKLMAPQTPNLSITFCAIPIFVSRDGQQIKAEELEFPVGHFSQVNEQGNKILQELVVAYSEGQEQITELYAGAGNFTFPLAQNAQKVVAVEADRALVKYGILQSQKLGLDHKIEFVRKSCEKYVRKNALLECVVLDPPRSGAVEVAEKLDPEVTKKVIYVSCALPTLCRDIKILTAKGYKLVETKVVDMFPQTHHVETVSLLVS
jgi:23S rRNA (uracil1939-C5)-methyltransferase